MSILSCHQNIKNYVPLTPVPTYLYYNFYNLLLQEPPEPIKIGAGEFACPLCSKTMKRKDHMKDHILIHTGEKRFFCTICHRFFNRKSSLNRHIEKTHALGPVEPKIEMVVEQSSADPQWILDQKFRIKKSFKILQLYNEIVNIVNKTNQVHV